MDTFSVGAMVRFGWETFKKRPWFFVGATVVYMLASWLIGSVTQFVAGLVAGDAAAGITSFVLSFFLNTLLGMGMISFALKAHDNVDAVGIADLWHPQSYGSYLFVSVLTSLAVLGGLILLIVPGIIFALMFMFGYYFVIDKNAGPLEAMKESKRITAGHKWDLALLSLAIGGITILGLLALLVGLLVTTPITILALAHAYRTLSGQASSQTGAPAVA